jgi:hypothetical protein
MLFSRLCLILYLGAATSGLGGGGEREGGDGEGEEGNGENNFELGEEELEEINIEIIVGNKKNSNWLVFDKHFICTQKDKSVDGIFFYWVCRYRRQFNCPFMAHTQVTFLLSPFTHTFYCIFRF